MGGVWRNLRGGSTRGPGRRERGEALADGLQIGGRVDAGRRRVVVDQVASLTDRSVLAWYADLCA